MLKLKTHKATARRFKITGSDKLRWRKQRRGHLRRRKGKRVKGQFCRTCRSTQPTPNACGGF